MSRYERNRRRRGQSVPRNDITQSHEREGNRNVNRRHSLGRIVGNQNVNRHHSREREGNRNVNRCHSLGREGIEI